MISLNRYNIHKILFPVAAGFAALSLLIFLVLQPSADDLLSFILKPNSKEVLKVILISGTLPATLVISIFGLLIKLTRSRHPKELERLARIKADRLLQEIAQSKEGFPLRKISGGVVRMTELIKDHKPPMSHNWAELLEELHELVPAYLLPGSFDEKDGPLLDWHKYDLCIIAAKENVEFAKSIKKALLRLHPDREWRIHIEEGDPFGVEQVRHIQSVFYGGSWKCLALLSIHMISSRRNRDELNWALRRAQRVDSHAYRNYLIPVALDRHGLDFMVRDPYLKKYAENLTDIPESGKLFNEIVKTLSSRLGGGGAAPTPQEPGDDHTEAPAKRFAVALSFPGEHRPFVKVVADKLKQQLPEREVFYDEYYTHELARLDLDLKLQKIYGEKSELVVIFLCKDYVAKQWCGLEWRAVRELIKNKQSGAIMPVRFDNTHIPGLFSIDGYVNAEHSDPEEIADLIMRRLSLVGLRQ